MLATTPAAVVEPKKKSQDPAAKAKRLQVLLITNLVDFAEAVSEVRAAAKMWEDAHGDLHSKYMIMMGQALCLS
jgi:hypothetical protein